MSGQITIAAVSRELGDEEKQKGLSVELVANDPIAVFVAKDNHVWDLKDYQLKNIFQGEIKNWSEIKPGVPGNIKVINRSAASGTRNVFQEKVLKGESFGENIITQEPDETTPIIQDIGKV